MTAAAYATDLSDISTAESTTGWAEMTGHTSGGAQTQESDYYIQGSYCVSQSFGTKTGTPAGLEFDYGSNVTWNTGDCAFIWQVCLAGNAMDTFANGGMRIAIGSTTGNVNFWKTGGNNFGRNPYGGWQNVAVDPTYTADYTEGSPTAGNYRIFGSLPNIISAISKGNMHGVDAIRKGRGQLKVEYGQAAAYGTFVGMAAKNDANDATNGYNRWGLFQAIPGGYLWKGLMSLGTATNAVDFRDANRNIIVDNTPRTYAAFNKIEIRNASSRVDWTSISIQAQDAVANLLSPGAFEVVDDCDVNFSKCTFTDMSTFVFKTLGEALDCTWRRCMAVTGGGTKFNGSLFDSSAVAADAAAVVWDVNEDVDGHFDGCTFIEDGGGDTHAIQLGTSSPTSVTFRNCTFTGYSASNSVNSSTFLVSRTTGTVTINVVGCAGNVTYKSAGATVVISSNPVSATVTTKDTAVPPVAISGVRVLMLAYSGGPMPYNVTVTITNSGTTATVSHTSHGMATNDKVQILGASHWQNNGVFSITRINDDSYSYTMPSAPGSDPTGTIKATFAALEGTTDVNGQITMSRSFTSDQPVTGRARKSSSAPYYKTTDFVGTIDSVNGFDIIVQLPPDA